MRENHLILRKKKVEEVIKEPEADYRDDKEVKKALAAFLNSLTDDVVPFGKPPAAKYFHNLENISISRIDESSEGETEKIFEQVEIHGDDFNGQTLTKEMLRKEGLMPKHMIVMGEVVTWLSSSAYDLGDGRIAVMAYVKKDGKIVARSYYRSNSQGGIWRFMPDYFERDGRILWYGKGWSEEGVTLPSILQEALAKISGDNMPILEVSNPDLIFAGAARNYYGNQETTYVREVESEPKYLKGISGQKPLLEKNKGNVEKINPREIILDRGNSPDFSQLLTSWKQNTTLYGPVTLEVFPSRDGKLKFTFCKTEDGKAMVGAIEDNSEMQSTGLRKSWIQGGDLTTPIFEYVQQAGKYGNPKIRSGNYIDMFENYLSKIPVIQEYLARNPLELIR